MKARLTAIECFRYPHADILGVVDRAQHLGREVVKGRLQFRMPWGRLALMADLSIYETKELFKNTVAELARYLDDREGKKLIPSPYEVGNKWRNR